MSDRPSLRLNLQCLVCVTVRLSGAVVVCCDRFRPYIDLHKSVKMDGTFLFFFCALIVLSYLMPATGLVYMVMLICCGLYNGHWVNNWDVAKSKVVSDPVSVVCMYVACWETVGLYPRIVQIAGGSRVEFGAPSDFFAIPLTDRFCELLLFREKLKTSSWILMERLSLKTSHGFR